MNPKCYPYPDFLNLSEKLTQEQQMVQKSVRDFVTSEIEPNIQSYYNNEKLPMNLLSKLGEMGLLGSNLSDYSLPNMDSISYGLIMKELERCDSGLRSFVSVQSALVMYAIHEFGDHRQKSFWLPKLASGEFIGCFGLTESEGGSDPSNMRTHVKKNSHGWLLNGSKMWITTGSLAQIAIVWAQTPDGMRGFIVPTNAQGFKAPLMQGKMSLLGFCNL